MIARMHQKKNSKIASHTAEKWLFKYVGHLKWPSRAAKCPLWTRLPALHPSKLQLSRTILGIEIRHLYKKLWPKNAQKCPTWGSKRPKKAQLHRPVSGQK